LYFKTVSLIFEISILKVLGFSKETWRFLVLRILDDGQSPGTLNKAHVWNNALPETGYMLNFQARTHKYTNTELNPDIGVLDQ
jgi:hypothetical protein